MVYLENICKNYENKEVLKNISLHIPKGKFVVIIGPSGCGKTTTLKIINQLLKPDSGKVIIDGKDVSEENEEELRRHIGYVIQQIGLFPNMTVKENILVVPKLLKYEKEKCDSIVKDLLKIVHMEGFADKYPNELSGGQQQRIGVLRALAASPPLLLMDEPFGALDPQTRAVLQEELKGIQKKFNQTIVFVTHDMDEAIKLADIIAFLDEGEIVQIATPKEMLSHPKTERIRAFLDKQLLGNGKYAYVEHLADSNFESVLFDTSVSECLKRIESNNYAFLLVKDDSGHFLGVAYNESLKEVRNQSETVGNIVFKESAIAYVGERSQDVLKLFLKNNQDVLIVLNSDDTIFGIMTRNSIIEKLLNYVW